MNKNSLQEKVEALSDAFQSTFTLFPDGTLGNLFHEDERPVVADLVRKHMGATDVVFSKAEGFENDRYAVWIVRYR